MRIAVGLVLLVSCGGSGSGDMQMSATTASVPPIDRETPAGLETATFALG